MYSLTSRCHSLFNVNFQKIFKNHCVKLPFSKYHNIIVIMKQSKPLEIIKIGWSVLEKTDKEVLTHNKEGEKITKIIKNQCAQLEIRNCCHIIIITHLTISLKIIKIGLAVWEKLGSEFLIHNKEGRKL